MERRSRRSCKNQPHVIQKAVEGSTLFSSLLIILLPKCTFCVAAYSGAVVLCSGRSFMPTHSLDGQIIFAFLSLIILFGLLRNPRGKRTAWSLMMVTISLALLFWMISHQIHGIAYLMASIVLFVGIWINGSFSSFFKKIKTINFKISKA